ncbi:GNAT family N-acetyltransferase [Caballeronia sp.]|uniref:GNAT family N-acetyltransferase n=1 Tax=Caballeronia sp. TaxID=1931223 RepID=UPI003C5BA396
MSQSSSNPLRIRTMTSADVAIALAWAEAEGWNPGRHDAECFYAADPNGFFIGEVGALPVACLSAVAYDNAFGFIGLYIVKPEWRGKGLGMQLWQHGLGYLADRNIGLDGVVAQQGNYRRSGFQFAYRNVQYCGVGQSCPHSKGVVRASDVPIEQLAAYDRRYFPAERHPFLRRWIAQPDSLAVVALAAGKIRGFGVVRACCVGHKIGPLFANDAQVAANLFDALSAAVAGQPLFIDVPELNAAALQLAERHGMSSVFETARMYTQAQPGIDLQGVFGVTTFELG